MTRRVLRPQPIWDHGALGIEDNAGRWVFCSNTEQGFAEGLPRSRFKMPYATGDRLWVREAFRGDVGYEAYPPREWSHWPVHYEADEYGGADSGNGRLRPGIHMPRWASRITLTVTEVRVQRLNELTEEDAVAEGCGAKLGGWFSAPGLNEYERTARIAFGGLWNSLHGPGAWDENPWVAAISFRCHLGNIDQMGGGDA